MLYNTGFYEALGALNMVQLKKRERKKKERKKQPVAYVRSLQSRVDFSDTGLF